MSPLRYGEAMERLHGARQSYDWGSTHAIPAFLSQPENGEPWAEQWFGAHPAAPSTLGSGQQLTDAIAADSAAMLGEDVLRRFGPQLPYLLKIIAPSKALSLQVHPSIPQAEEGFELENESGIPLDAPVRSFKDRNHKPEMVLAVEPFEAVAGFRAPRRAAEVLAGLKSPLARRIRQSLRMNPTRFGIRHTFTELVSSGSKPTPEEVTELVDELAARLEAGESPSMRVDRNAVTMAEAFPGDSGIAAALLLNPVTLQPGEALFVPAGSVHAYISGLGVEIMANSDNVLRAGLSTKHVDVPAMLACVDYVAAPPVRPAPEYLSHVTRAYYAPVDDFELLVAELSAEDARIPLPGHGPRILLGLGGELRISSPTQELTIARGEAVFVSAEERFLWVEGTGTVVQADVP